MDLLLRGAAPDDPVIDMLPDAAGDVAAGFSVRSDSCGLQAPVFLLHGEHDCMPSSESRVLAEHLRRARVDVDLVLTPLLSHGDTAIGSKALLHAPTLVRGLARFLGNAGAGRSIHVHHEAVFCPDLENRIEMRQSWDTTRPDIRPSGGCLRSRQGRLAPSHERVPTAAQRVRGTLHRYASGTTIVLRPRVTTCSAGNHGDD